MHFDIRIRFGEIGEPRNEPAHRKRRKHVGRDDRAARGIGDAQTRLLDEFERIVRDGEIVAPRRREFDGAATPLEERHAERGLERLDLAADRTIA